MFYVAKSMQLAGLVTVGVALVNGIIQSDADGAMTREISGTILGIAVFWIGRWIEAR